MFCQCEIDVVKCCIRTRGLVAKRSLHMRKIDGPIPSESTVNILFFSRLFYPHIGGVEKHVLEISRLLIKKGYKVTIVTEQHEKKIKIKEEFKDIKIYRISDLKEGWFKKFRIWAWLWKNSYLIKEADIIHAHDVFFWYLPFRFLYPKKPVYTTFHGYEGNNLPTKKAIFMHKVAEKLSKGNICVGEYLKKWYGTKPDYVTYGGVEISNIKYHPSADVSNIKKGEDVKRVVFVGRLEDETGVMEYLKAVKILKEKGYKIKLDVLGDGSLRKKAEAFCFRNGLNVKFHGFVENVVKFLAQSSFAFTSRYLGILEALASKKFVFVVYNNPIKKDCFRMSPFADVIVLAKNERSLVSKFIHYIKNKDSMCAKIANGYEWVCGQTWDEVERLYLKLWRQNEKNTNY